MDGKYVSPGRLVPPHVLNPFSPPSESLEGVVPSSLFPSLELSGMTAEVDTGQQESPE